MSSGDLQNKLNSQVAPNKNQMNSGMPQAQMNKNSFMFSQQQQRFNQPTHQIPSSSPSFPQQPQVGGNWGMPGNPGNGQHDPMNTNGTALWQKNLIRQPNEQQMGFNNTPCGTRTTTW